MATQDPEVLTPKLKKNHISYSSKASNKSKQSCSQMSNSSSSFVKIDDEIFNKKHKFGNKSSFNNPQQGDSNNQNVLVYESQMFQDLRESKSLNNSEKKRKYQQDDNTQYKQIQPKNKRKSLLIEKQNQEKENIKNYENCSNNDTYSEKSSQKSQFYKITKDNRSNSKYSESDFSQKIIKNHIIQQQQQQQFNSDMDENDVLDNLNLQQSNSVFLQIFDKKMENLDSDLELYKFISNNQKDLKCLKQMQNLNKLPQDFSYEQIESNLQQKQNSNSNSNNSTSSKKYYHKKNQQSKGGIIEFINSAEQQHIEQQQQIDVQNQDKNDNQYNVKQEQQQQQQDLNSKQNSQQENQQSEIEQQEKLINLQNYSKIKEINQNELIFVNFDQVWFQQMNANQNDGNVKNKTEIQNPVKTDKIWQEKIKKCQNITQSIPLFKYSLDEIMLNDFKKIQNPVILGIQGSISEQIIPLIHDLDCVIGIIIYGTSRMAERIQNNGFTLTHYKIQQIVQYLEECYDQFLDFYGYFYRQKIYKYQELNKKLGQNQPFSNYLLKAPLQILQGPNYFMKNGFQDLNFYIMSNFSELQDVNEQFLEQNLERLENLIKKLKIKFDLRVFNSDKKNQIIKGFMDCIKEHSTNQQEVANKFLDFYLNSQTYYKFINQIIESMNDQVLQQAKLFITSLRLSVQIFQDFEEFWDQESIEQQQQINIHMDGGALNPKDLASNIQDCQKVLNPTISLYVGDRFHKEKYLNQEFKKGDLIVFPNFTRAVKDLEIGKQLAKSGDSKQTIFQIQFKKSQFQKKQVTKSNFSLKLKTLINMENYRPKSIKQFWKTNYQHYVKEYIINCLQTFKVQDIDDNFDEGFLLVKLISQ